MNAPLPLERRLNSEAKRGTNARGEHAGEHAAEMRRN